MENSPLEEESDSAENTSGDARKVGAVLVSKKGFLFKEVIEEAERRTETPESERKKIIEDLRQKYWNETWFEKVKEVLPWPAFDEEMKKQVKDDFESVLKWMATFIVQGSTTSSFKMVQKTGSDSKPVFYPREELASPLITMAKFLAEQTDDPKTGVGAVAIDELAKNIVALGWNGYPIKAQYGGFARASKSDPEVKKKYPYVIHAEQNALLMRNTQDINKGTLFVTKTPCNECASLVKMVGIKTVVLAGKMTRSEEKETPEKLTYSKFPKKVDDGVFFCFEFEDSKLRRHGDGGDQSGSVECTDAGGNP